MPREYLCQYGNCHETTIRVSVNMGDERPKFCCAEHAGLYLLAYALRCTNYHQRADFMARIVAALERY